MWQCVSETESPERNHFQFTVSPEPPAPTHSAHTMTTLLCYLGDLDTCLPLALYDVTSYSTEASSLYHYHVRIIGQTSQEMLITTELDLLLKTSQ